MKKKGTHSDYLEERNQNLRREFFARLGRGSRTVREIFIDMSRIPADRFYISEERALLYVRAAIEGNAFLCGRSPQIRTRSLMLADILKGVEALRRRLPSLPLRDAVFRVVNSPAPSFYLTPRSIRTLIYRML